MDSETPEYRTLIAHTDGIKRTIQFNLTTVNSALYGEGIIPSDASESIGNVMHPESNRAAHLVRVVQERVREDPEHYYTFVGVLKRADSLYFDGILQTLAKTKQRLEGNLSPQSKEDATDEDQKNESGQTHSRSHLKQRSGKSVKVDTDDDNVDLVDSGSKVKLTRQDSHSSSWAHVNTLTCGVMVVAVVLVSSVLVALAVNYYKQAPPTAPPTSSTPPTSSSIPAPNETPDGSHNDHQKRPKQCTRISNTFVLFQELKEIHVDLWEHLCLNLGVSSRTRNALKNENIKKSSKKRRCLEAFCKEDTEPGVMVCWETVVSAVRKDPISNYRLAEEIQENHVINLMLVHN